MFWSLWFLSFYFFVPLHWLPMCVLCYCGRVCLCTRLSFCFSCMCAWYMSVCPSVCVCACVYMYVSVYCPTTIHAPPTRIPGGECRQWGRTGGRGHPRDQCDRRGRRANDQRRLPAATPWWPCPVWRRNVGRRLRGQPGPQRSWLRYPGSGGQEAEVCEANGGEWGFWVSLHREEPVLRPCPSFPLPHSWGNLGNRVWGRGLKKLHDDFPLFTFCAGLHHPFFA